MDLYPPNTVVPIYLLFAAAGVALTGLRFWTRHRYRLRVGLDDWFALVALVIVCTCVSIQTYNAIDGEGGRAVSPEDADRAAILEYKVQLATLVIEKPAFGFIKLSLLFFYKRIFAPWRIFRILNYVMVGVVVVWFLSFMTADLLICGSHLEYSWLIDQTIAGRHCGNKGILLLMFGATSVLTDLLVLLLPLLYVQKLQMSTFKKWAAAGVFFLGFTSTFAGLLRTIFLAIAYPMGRLAWVYVPPPDSETPMVLQVINPTFWVLMEMELGIWAINLLTIGPLLRQLNIGSAISSLYSRISGTSTSTTASGNSRKTRRSTVKSATTVSCEMVPPHHENDSAAALATKQSWSSTDWA